MKLQKLLFFAQLIRLARYNKLLFNDEFCAFENGMVMENVRLEYKNNLPNLLNYPRRDFNKEEIEVLELTKDIYGSEDADTLCDMTHHFEYWKKYFQLSNDKDNYKNKKKAVVPNEELKKELDNIKDVLDAYEMLKNNDNISYKELDY